MGFFTFLVLVVLCILVHNLRQRVTELNELRGKIEVDLRELQRRQQQLERDWRDHQARRDEREGPAASRPAPLPTQPAERTAPPPIVLPPVPSAPVEPPTAATAPGMPATPELPADEEVLAGGSWLEPPHPHADSLSFDPAHSERAESFTAAAHSLISFFTTGNVVAKVGVIIVFFGVAFLLRYAAERGMLPIEFRLMATALGAFVLLTIGWRLRESRPEYAVVLQGGAVGILYLTIFVAFRLYALLPASLTFALLLMVVACSGVLAVVQNAIPLAVLGTAGGFLAPILASTGAGSHVALFSYYAVLNLGVLGISWFRSWRFLNWLAFVFTFGIGFIWGAQFYQPAFFATTEPFLVFFFLLFTAIAVLFAHRQPPQLRGYIDGSLVFGTPSLAFAMQSVLVAEIPFGRAYSALVLSAWYLMLARTLWRRDATLRPLAEAFLALGVVFLILVVPLAFDGHATAAAWALEGAGLIWIGIRQHRLLARWVGAALLLGAGMAFAAIATPPLNGLAVLNTRFLASAAIATASVIGGRLLWGARERLGPSDRVLEWVLLVWGLVWWFAAVQVEIIDHVPSRLIVSSSLLALAGSACVIAFIARRWAWRNLTLAMMPLGPLMWVWVVPVFALSSGYTSPLADRGWLAWPAVLASSYLLVGWSEAVWPRVMTGLWHVGATWLLIFLTTWTLAIEVHRLVPETATWSLAVWCIVPALFVAAAPTLRRALPWPVGRFTWLYTVLVPAVLVAVTLTWVVASYALAGEPAPLPYVPLLNPLEITQAIAFIVAYAWWTRVEGLGSIEDSTRLAVRGILALLAFIALNVVIGRSVHVYLNVPFDFESLARSSVMQTGVSILWGVTAGVLMTVARQRLDRFVWMVGAGLLATLIVKLFVIDLSNIGRVARIVSFLATGVLILLIGYLAPAPPRSPGPTEAGPHTPSREQTT